MDYQSKYQSKLTTPEKAVSVVKSGDWVDYTTAANVPNILDKALADRAEELEDVNIRGYLAQKPLEIYKANDRVGKCVFTYNSWYYGSEDRKYASKGYTYFIPMRFCELPEMYRREDEVERVDVAMLQVAPMDNHGYFNLGLTSAALKEVVRRAKQVIVEVNPKMPRVFGLYDEALHIDEIDAIVEYESDLVTLKGAQPSEVDIQIANLILPHIPNGATLQLGVGGLPNAVGHSLAKSDLKDLGIHTEMYLDSMMEMAKAGLITGAKKNINPGKQVCTFGLGSQELYDYLKENPTVLTAPVDYVNSPNVIAQLDNYISINNAVEVDFHGQVSAESSGMKQISGTGGQLDFMIGAYHSKGGKSFIALSSTFNSKDGEQHSRIVPSFKPGTQTTDPRTCTHYIATEYGIFNVRGKSIWQRAEGLINIAHPDFREELIAEAEKNGIWRNSNKR